MNFNNNLLEFGSSADIIATAICDFSTSRKEYKKNDIVFKLKNIPINFNYKQHNSQSSGKVTNLSYHDYILSGLTINFVPFDTQILDLFSSKTEEEFYITETEELECFSNTLFLSYQPIDETVIVENLENFTINNYNGLYSIVSNDLVDGQKYNISYQRKVLKSVFVMENMEADIPYLHLQIHFIGNSDKEDDDYYLIIPKVKINYMPSFNLINKSVASCTLTGVIIDGLNYKPVMLV